MSYIQVCDRCGGTEKVWYMIDVRPTGTLGFGHTINHLCKECYQEMFKHKEAKK